MATILGRAARLRPAIDETSARIDGRPDQIRRPCWVAVRFSDGSSGVYYTESAAGALAVTRLVRAVDPTARYSVAPAGVSIDRPGCGKDGR